MEHEMIRTSPESGIWECPSCPRVVVVTRTHFKVLNQGDFEARHFGSLMAGLDLREVRIEPRS